MAKEKFTKSELVERVAETVGLNKKQTHAAIDSFFEEIKEALLDKKTIEFRGFGTFEVRQRKGREKARNPKTGQSVQVESHGVVVFRPGKELKAEAWKLL